MGGFDQQGAHVAVPLLGDRADAALARGVLARHEPEVGLDLVGVLEALGLVDDGDEGCRDDQADTGSRAETLDHGLGHAELLDLLRHVDDLWREHLERRLEGEDKRARLRVGPDRQSVAEVRVHLVDVLTMLHRELLEGSYRPGLIRRVWIPKSGGGERGLGIPDVIDRLVQQAVHQVLSPNYEPTFHGSSHGFRPGRSCHTAIAEAVSHLEEGHEWVVDLDLAQFFDRVHHDRLLARLELRVKDRRLICLIRRMLKAKVVMPNGVVVSTEEGAPQGGPLSPLLSNIVLDELDWELARRGHRFVRYADDCNIYVRSERSGQRVMAGVTRFIEGRLRLTVNAKKSAVARPEERHFVGFRLRREPEDGRVEVLLSKRSKARIDEKIRELTPRNWGQSLRACILAINAYLLGWIGFFWICTEAGVQVLSSLDAHLRRRLRALILRDWKRKRTMVRRLIQLGVKPKTAWRVYQGHRSWWALSHFSPVDRGLRNAYFAERGLVSLAIRWRELQSKRVVAPVQLTLALG